MKTKTKKTEKNKSIKRDKSEEKKEIDDKSFADEKEKSKKKVGVRLLKCEFCQNIIPDPKKNFEFFLSTPIMSSLYFSFNIKKQF